MGGVPASELQTDRNARKGHGGVVSKAVNQAHRRWECRRPMGRVQDSSDGPEGSVSLESPDEYRRKGRRRTHHWEGKEEFCWTGA